MENEQELPPLLRDELRMALTTLLERAQTFSENRGTTKITNCDLAAAAHALLLPDVFSPQIPDVSDTLTRSVFADGGVQIAYNTTPQPPNLPPLLTEVLNRSTAECTLRARLPAQLGKELRDTITNLSSPEPATRDAAAAVLAGRRLGPAAAPALATTGRVYLQSWQGAATADDVAGVAGVLIGIEALMTSELGAHTDAVLATLLGVVGQKAPMLPAPAPTRDVATLTAAAWPPPVPSLRRFASRLALRVLEGDRERSVRSARLMRQRGQSGEEGEDYVSACLSLAEAIEARL